METSGEAKSSAMTGGAARVVPETLEALEPLPLWEHPLGEVFASRVGKGGRLLQLTVLRKELVRRDQGLRLCVDTNAMLEELQCPYIPPLVEARRLADGRVVLAVDRLGGQPLAQQLLDGPMPPGRVVAILRQLCRALDVAHGLGIRHGALSLASVLLVEHEGRADAVRLLDFGLEDELGVEAMGDHEVESQPLSPEKVSGRVPDLSEDVYLLGAVGYAAIAGRPLFKGDAKAVRAAHESATPDALDCDAPLAAVILRCLAKDPAKRFTDMRSIDDALVGAQELSGFKSAWDDLRPMAGSGTSGAQAKVKPLGLGSFGKIPAGPYGVVPVDRGKAMTPAEKLAEKLKADKKPDGEGKAMTPAEKLAEKLKAERRAKAEKQAEAERLAKAEKQAGADGSEAAKKAGADEQAEAARKAEADQKTEVAKQIESAMKLELKRVEPEKKLDGARNISPSASSTFDATELIEDVRSAADSGSFASPPPPPKVRQPVFTPVPSPGKVSPIAPPPVTKSASSSGSSFDRAATLSPNISGASFDRAATLGLSLGRASTETGKLPSSPSIPIVAPRSADAKPTPLPQVDSKPIGVPIALPKVDSKPPIALPKVEARPTPAPIAVPKVEARPTPAPIAVPKVEARPTPAPLPTLAKVDSKPIAVPVAVPKVDSKPPTLAKVDSKPIAVPVAVPKVDSKPPTLAKVDSKPIAVPKADSKPTPAAEPQPTTPTPGAEAAESMTHEVVEESAASRTEGLAARPTTPSEAPVAATPATPAAAPEPSVAIVTPWSTPEERESRKTRSVGLMVAGVVLLIGLPVAWLALRDDSTPTTAAAEGKPKGPEEDQPEVALKAPEPAPKAPVAPPEPIEPPVDDGAPPPDPVADPEGGQPAADGGAEPPPPDPEPVATPEPAPRPKRSGTPAAPSPQEKARELIRAGDKAYAAGQLGKAESKYKAALAEHSRAHAAAAGLGRIAFNKAAYADAASHYGRAVKAAGSNSGYRILYGDALFKLGKYADAKVQYTKAKSLGNGQADARLKKVAGKL